MGSSKSKGSSGAPKGYEKTQTLSSGQKRVLEKQGRQAIKNTEAAREAYKQFLPGSQGLNQFFGGLATDVTQAANKNFQQNTLPSILNSFGSDSKSSSALNQALAAGAAGLNTDLAAQLAGLKQNQAQMGFNAAQSIGSLGSGQANLYSQTPMFAFNQKQTPFWKQATLGALQAAGTIGGAYLGGPLGATAGNAGATAIGNTFGLGAP
jgi:hypothetical protein